MIEVRNYTESDWEMIGAWWKASGEVAPLPSMMPAESSFVASKDGLPVVSVSVYLTNTPEVAYVENFIANPEINSNDRRDVVQVLSDRVDSFVKARGFKRLLCMTEKPVLKNRYEDLGFRPTLHNVTTFVRSV